MKQRIFRFKIGEDIPLGAQYLHSEFDEEIKAFTHCFLCFVDKEGKPIDAPTEEPPADFLD